MFPRRALLPVLVTLIALAFTACSTTGTGTESGAGTGAGDAVGVQDVGSGAPSTFDELRDALAAQGHAVMQGDAIDQPFHDEPAAALLVDGQTVQVFSFEDAGAAEAFAATVAPDASSVGTTLPTWVETPRFYRSGPLVVLYVGEDTGVSTALASLLGPPFAEGAAPSE